MIILSLIVNLFWQASSAVVIHGYTDKLSVLPGDSLTLFIHASESQASYDLKLHNMKGDVVYQVNIGVFPQEILKEDAYEKGFRYKKTAKVMVPELPSGIYLWENKIPFIIKSRRANVVVVYPSNTENAYNNEGGKSLYGFNSTDKTEAKVVSFMRPHAIEKFSESFLRWMSKQEFSDVGYITDADMDDYTEIRKARLLIIPGHSEYWTLAARKNFDRFVAEGRDALILSGNTMWWQVRYSKAKDQLICYRKEKDDKIKSTRLKTILWNDVSLNYPVLRSIGVDFSLAGYGTKTDKGWDGYKLICQSPLFQNTSLNKGDILPLASQETDGAPLIQVSDGIPMLNKQALGFYKAEIVGYDQVSRGGSDGVATWIVFKPTRISGTVINVASTNWCSGNGIGVNVNIQTITKNMITKLLNKEEVFSPEEPVTAQLVPHQ
jgi:hypothetical protein